MKKYLSVFLALVLALGVSVGIISLGDASLISESGLRLPAVYGNHMVFQRGKDINVRGYYDAEGAEISVSLYRGEELVEEKTATVEGGEWNASLSPLSAEFGLTLRVAPSASPSEAKTYEDISVGEVVLVSGQSNAFLEAKHLLDLEEQLNLLTNYKNLRLYSSVPSLALRESELGSGSWHLPSRSLLVNGTEGASGRFSALGLVVGMRLCEELGANVPVAVITAARGSSKVRAWLSEETFATLSPNEASNFAYEREYFEEHGKYQNSSYAVGREHVNFGTVCYNSMIAPLRGFNIANVIWYQGEGDSNPANGTLAAAHGYSGYFEAVMSDYRKIFGGDDNLPFYMVQLATYRLPTASDTYQSYPSDFRAEQYDIAQSLSGDNVYLVPASNGDCTFTTKDSVADMLIHPTKKSILANRIAAVMLKNQYGCDVRGGIVPTVISTETYTTVACIKFNTPMTSVGALYGFEVKVGGVWRAANVTWDSDTDLVLMASGKIEGIRYAFGNPEVELDTGEVFRIKAFEKVLDASENYIGVRLTAEGGTVYEFTAEELDNGRIVDTRFVGNLYSAHGVPTPVFVVELS